MSVTVAMETAANEALPTLKTALLPFGAFSTDFSPKMAGGNQVVQVPIIGAITANETENSYQQGSSGVSIVKVTLDSYVQAPIAYTDVEQEKLESVSYWKPLFEEAYYSASNKILTKLLAEATAANLGNAIHTGAASTLDYDKVVDIRTALNVAKWPKTNRSLLLTSAYTGNIMKDVKISSNMNLGAGIVTEAQLPNVAGMTIRESDAIPGNSENLVGLACLKSFLGLAMRPPMPGIGGEKVVSYFTVTDAETGASFGVRTHYDSATGITYVNVECRYGYKIIDAARAKRIISA